MSVVKKDKGDRMMPLTLAQTNQMNTIIRIGGSPQVKRHLENLGFVPGTTISLINKLNGNVIVHIKDSRVALSEELAQKIMIGEG